MRTFIALPVPEEIKAILGSLEEELKTKDVDVKWVNPQNIHITLKFLGEIEENRLSLIKKTLDKTFQATLAFPVTLS
ncbi:MAG: RNA 2',3'-cyclic phosphodiesterase, partial [Candidatus Omnitrophica bacterium]|nr:RNA 2',3'-cyclic phosphodiesterase [Candidatus Omnitrophota bacterium]